MRIVRRLRRVRGRDLVLLVRAFGAVVTARSYLLRRNHDGLRRRIDRHPTPLGTDVPNAALAEVAWSVRAAARLVRGATCLTQASAGQLLLASRGYATVIRVSVPARSSPGGGLAPHAWLLAQNTIVLGGTPHEYMLHRPLHDFTLPGVRGGA